MKRNYESDALATKSFFMSSKKSPLFSTATTKTEAKKSFKERKTLEERKHEFDVLRELRPNRVPVIIERFKKEKTLPLIDKTKYLVPDKATVRDLIETIKRRLQIDKNQAFFLLVNERTLASVTMTVGDLYQRERDEDGFMYCVYASQPTFG